MHRLLTLLASFLFLVAFQPPTRNSDTRAVCNLSTVLAKAVVIGCHSHMLGWLRTWSSYKNGTGPWWRYILYKYWYVGDQRFDFIVEAVQIRKRDRESGLPFCPSIILASFQVQNRLFHYYYTLELGYNWRMSFDDWLLRIKILEPRTCTAALL